MASLNHLKRVLRQKSADVSSPSQQLSASQYLAGFNIVSHGETAYEDFIIPQLSQLLTPLFKSRANVSVLEIGPGPESVLGRLPGCLKRKIKRYAAFEPNELFATTIQDSFQSVARLPCLETSPEISRTAFSLDSDSTAGIDASSGLERFNLILFCHSLYGIGPKRSFIERALQMLVEDGLVIVVHRDGSLHLDGLVCLHTASFPTGMMCVTDDDEALDCFSQFVAGAVIQDPGGEKAVKIKRREACRALGFRDEAHPNQLLFASPNILAAFTQHATMLPKLTSQIPAVRNVAGVKNREARLHQPAAIVRPKDIQQVQQCISWALDHSTNLTVIGGGHGGQCLWPNVVAIDMSAFDQVDIIQDTGSQPLVVAGAGCKSGDIISKTMAAALSVPLGSRPGVGAGLWLQGGIGHLARQHGLTCDAIVGAIVVSVASAKAIIVGHVPSLHQPANAIQLDNGDDLLWGLKGAGTNFGIVISVTFKAHAAPKYTVRNWILPMKDRRVARLKLSEFDDMTAKLPRSQSADAYLYCDEGKLCLGVNMFEVSTSKQSTVGVTPTPSPPAATFLGPTNKCKTVDSLGLSDTEMYMTGMHGGHGGGKTSSFKRCVFLKGIGQESLADKLLAAIESRPSPRCYLHLLHGGGAIGDMAPNTTAFGCRDLNFACVITGIWDRDEDGSATARAVIQWVYDLAGGLLPLSTGVYAADLGPDPRDLSLATYAFGPNLPRLASLKRHLDPQDILAYACPLPQARTPRLIFLITGNSGAGKDYCADSWALTINTRSKIGLKARSVSISDATKRDYAAAKGADLERLFRDREYKEQHRPALTSYFRNQVRRRPQLPEKHFLDIVYSATDVDVLFVKGEYW